MIKIGEIKKFLENLISIIIILYFYSDQNWENKEIS